VTPDPDALRPRDFALLLLASGDTPATARPRPAATAPAELKRRVLEELVVLDPEPVLLEEALVEIVARFERDRSTRAVAVDILENGGRPR